MRRLNQVLEGKEGNYILPFFWQHGEDEAVLRDYMQAIKKSNIDEVCVESRPHPDFCGLKWWEDMDVILDEAEKLDMKVWILDDSHFPTGYANGALKDAPPELHHQYMTYRNLEISGPVSKAQFILKEYMMAEPLPPWIPQAPEEKPCNHDDDELVTILACKIEEDEKLGQIIDLTENVDEGIVTFDLDSGYWRIFVIYLTRYAKGRNDYINFLDDRSCRLLIDAVYEPHFKRYGKLFGNRIAGFFSDEPPVGNVPGYMPAGPIGSPSQVLPWSALAGDALTQAFGNEQWKTSLPFLWAEAHKYEDQVHMRTAYMNMVTRLVETCFSKQIGRWCQDHKVLYIGHMLEDCDMNTDLGPSMGHFFRGLSGQHMAGIDNIGGQVMIGGQDAMRHLQPAAQDEAGFYHYLLGKLGASHAAIDPKKMGRCMCENFGAYGWQFGMKDFKYMMDHFMVRGVNRFVPHAFSPKAFPDPDCPPHFYGHGHNPSFEAFGQLMAYSNRVCHLIDGGVSHPDIALLYNAESKWAGNGQSNIEAARRLSQAQVDFHVIPSDVFNGDNTYDMDWDGNHLIINGISYSGLVISPCDYLAPEVVAFIKMAGQSDFPIFVIDTYPKEVEMDIVHTDYDRLIEDIRKNISCQISLENQDSKFISYHYEERGQEESEMTHYYLFHNEDPGQAFDQWIHIRGQGKPFIYRPWENKSEDIEFEVTGQGLRVRCMMNPLELAILCVDRSENVQEYVNNPRGSKGPGKYRLCQEIQTMKVKLYDAFAYHKAGGRLEGLDLIGETILESPYTGIQHIYKDFSGYIRYETQIELEKDKAYRISIEDLSDSVEVFVDRLSLGIQVAPPFNFDFVHEGEGVSIKLSFMVATKLERLLKSKGHDIKSMSPYRPLSPTGILGKVTLYEKEKA